MEHVLAEGGYSRTSCWHSGGFRGLSEGGQLIVVLTEIAESTSSLSVFEVFLIFFLK